jgi:hypothetical protein
VSNTLTNDQVFKEFDFDQQKKMLALPPVLPSTPKAPGRDVSAFRKYAEMMSLFSRTRPEGIKTCAGDRDGVPEDKPRWSRILVIAALSRMVAMIFVVPPQCGQCSMLILNTRFSKRAQLIRTKARG